MVTFRLIEENDKYIIYWYFPEGKEECGHGVIIIDKQKEEISTTQLAPGDFSRVVSPDELNEMRNSVNNMRKVEGDPELTEEKWPSAKEEITIAFFADHAVSKILEGYNSGEILGNGMVAWY